ncbi:iron-dependent peroxidase [Paenibacillus sp. NPDC058071]|uniref:iron-dependent peroxidase n=1 Tax=Paenibacillus sp. NPDC058071 TaxID=3346326 RepID=UPI0036D85ACD
MGLNYVWDLTIKAERTGREKKTMYFVPAKVYSPYMELSLVDLNAVRIEREIEVNPYYRFYDIFRDMFTPDNEEYAELRAALFDIMMHFLTDIDRMQGMNRREYYIRFVLKDMEDGLFGEDVRRGLALFDREEREIIAANVLRLYETGEAVYLLKDTMRKLFRRSTIYVNCEEKDELVFYVGQKESPETKARIELVRSIFLPIRFDTEIYWEYHFGIQGYEETMQIDRIALY